MSLNILFSAAPDRWAEYQAPLADAFEKAGLDVTLSTDLPSHDVDYIVYAPNGPVWDFSSFSRLKAVLGLWAGVEGIVGNKTLRVPLTRMVDTGLSEGMAEWVCGHVLRYHLGIDEQLAGQDGRWMPRVPPLARDRRVGILGLGALGSACATALKQLNFDVAGYARRPKEIDGVQGYSGKEGLTAVLERSQIIVLLLPLTPETENILNEETLKLLPKGAFILNPGRGGLIDDVALLKALDSGHIAHATLDVFRQEPLPPENPFWSHPQVTVTPHIASETRAETAALAIVDNVVRHEAGLPLRHLVDREAGY